MCGGDGGFMSIYGGESMAPGTPKDIHFNVELNTDVSKRKVFLIWQYRHFMSYIVLYTTVYTI